MVIVACVFTFFILIGVVLLILAQIRANRKGEKIPVKLRILFVCGVCYLFLFYCPSKNLFPEEDYAPISIHVSNLPSSAPFFLNLEEETASEILRRCNQIWASRSVFQTLFRYTGGQDMYIYFSGKGDNWSETGIGYSHRAARSTIRKNGFVFYSWNKVDLDPYLALSENPV